MTTTAIGFGHHSKPNLTIGWITPRMAAAATGIAISQSDRPDKLTWPRYIKPTPTTIAAKPSSCGPRTRSPRMTIARRTATTGVMLLSVPAIFGPIRRLDSKFRSAAAPGKNNPTHANKTMAFRLPSLGSTKNGARHQNSSVEVGMLIATPTQGSIHRNANWVRTKPAPKPNIDTRARKIAAVMGALPHESIDRRSKIVGRAIPDNAEVANHDFGKS